MVIALGDGMLPNPLFACMAENTSLPTIAVGSKQTVGGGECPKTLDETRSELLIGGGSGVYW